MNILFLLCLLLVGLRPCQAASLPDDFAYGVPLALEAEGAVYAFSLPENVYRSVTRDDFGDIRIFNGRQEAVPHALRRPRDNRRIVVNKQALPYFPLYADARDEGTEKGLAMRIRTGENGAIINVEPTAKSNSGDRIIGAYLLDASSLAMAPAALEVDWQGQEVHFLTSVALEASNDLTGWSRLVPETTIASLDFEGHRISRNTVELPAGRTSWKYFRLTWPAGKQGVALSQVSAVYRGPEAPEPERLWAGLAAASIAGQDKAGLKPGGPAVAYEYDSEARLPVDAIRLEFPEQNTLVEATIYSRPDRQAAWQRRYAGTFHHLRFGETVLASDTAQVSMCTDRYWRLEISSGAASGQANIPVLKLGWLPHEVLFVARGEGPFMLAYGSARLQDEAAPSTPEVLTRALGTAANTLIKQARLQDRVNLGGPERLKPPPPPLPWRKWLLWAVLLAGVGIIAWMALSLRRQMDDDRGDSGQLPES